MERKKINLIFFMSVHASQKDMEKNPAYSGGDNILINLLKRWQSLFDINVFTWSGGRYFLETVSKIKGVGYREVLKLKRMWRYPWIIIARALKGLCWAVRTKDIQGNVIYSPSDFIPDSLPAFILKLRNPKAIWIASLYLFFPNPFSFKNPYKGKLWFIGLVQYIVQFPIKYTIRRFADIVFVTSEPDKAFFITKKRSSDKVVVVRGGVDLEQYREVKEQPIRYDAVFMGRFHPQKGVVELIKIWKLVKEKMPNAKLAIIGQGETTAEERKIKNKLLELIEQYSLEDNIELLGFLSGKEKIEVFKSSKVFLHPAIYDSGGMAAAEAMACGLPGVSFDLEALKTYYPKGMLKTQCFNIQEFANNILNLLKDNKLYLNTSNDALELVKEQWDWNKRAEDIFKQLRLGK